MHTTIHERNSSSPRPPGEGNQAAQPLQPGGCKKTKTRDKAKLTLSSILYGPGPPGPPGFAKTAILVVLLEGLHIAHGAQRKTIHNHDLNRVGPHFNADAETCQLLGQQEAEDVRVTSRWKTRERRRRRENGIINLGRSSDNRRVHNEVDHGDDVGEGDRPRRRPRQPSSNQASNPSRVNGRKRADAVEHVLSDGLRHVGEHILRVGQRQVEEDNLSGGQRQVDEQLLSGGLGQVEKDFLLRRAPRRRGGTRR
mmetsp:Transcript_38615/g.100106  ORF Transcript_38615/g.100106 Transcript_38615/m.100106 type:complete len:253 (-) Transcript_38615:342-1100(-)